MANPLGLFEGIGIEIEYMIVDRGDLRVRPMCDVVLRALAGETVNEFCSDGVAWSNELALHVIELKTHGPVASLDGLPVRLQEQIRRVNELLRPENAMLLPSGAHPLMNPHTQTVLWPHGQDEIYRMYNRLFDCRGHGWANLQSAHLNLSFSGDDEFSRLHAAIRFLLPLLPAIAASTPVLEGKRCRALDERLVYYRRNQAAIPEISGQVIPESGIYSRSDYERIILQPMYRAVAAHDPQGILQEEWLNSRGAIARFERNAIEIRIVDAQECVSADLAIGALTQAALRWLIRQQPSSFQRQNEWPTAELADILSHTVSMASAAPIPDEYARVWGWRSSSDCRAIDLWGLIRRQVLPSAGFWDFALAVILSGGTLSERIVRALGPDFDERRIVSVYSRLADCLARGVMFEP